MSSSKGQVSEPANFKCNCEISHILSESWVNFYKDEYILIQNKIDRIGMFKFRIKGWLIPFVPLISYPLFSKDIPDFFFFTGAIFVPFIFWYMEEKQAILSRVACKRAERLELLLERIFDPFMNVRKKEVQVRQALKKLEKVPAIGREFKNSHRLSFGGILKNAFWNTGRAKVIERYYFYLWIYISFLISFIVSFECFILTLTAFLLIVVSVVYFLYKDNK